MKPIIIYTDELIRSAKSGRSPDTLYAFQREVSSSQALVYEFDYGRPSLLMSGASVPWVRAFIPDINLVVPDMGIHGDCPLVISMDAVSPWPWNNKIDVLRLYTAAVLNPQAFFEQPRARIKVSAAFGRPERHYLVGPRDLLGLDPK